MKTDYVSPALRELREAIAEAEQISGKPEVTKRDEARISVLLAKIATLNKNVGAATADRSTKWFRAFLQGNWQEMRANSDMLAGQQSITYTDATQGGSLVPQEFADVVISGMAQYDPLLDDSIVTLIKSKNFSLRPYPIPGWDMTTIAATKVNEGAQQTAGAPPVTSQVQLNSWTYRLSLDASIEFEEDNFQPFMEQFQAAAAIGFARGIGVDLVNGNGTTAPQGLTKGAANSNVTLTGGKLTIDSFLQVYFAVNRVHRAATKCGWVMSDECYQLVRSARDNSGRPLLNVKKDKEVLLGKPVYVSPSLQPAPSTGTSDIIFGDLSHYFVRVSGMSLVRATQLPGGVEYGKAFYTARMRADAKVLDPSNGLVPPIVYAIQE